MATRDFSCKGEKFGLLKDLIATTLFAENVRLQCSSSGIAVRELDTAHICVVDYSLQTSAFLEYKCDEPQVFAFSQPTVKKLIDGIDDNSPYEFYHEAKRDRLTLKTKFAGDQEEKMEFKMIDFDEERLPDPPADDGAIVQLPSELWSKCITKLKAHDDAVNISITPETITLTIHGDSSSADLIFRARNDSTKRVETTDKKKSISDAIIINTRENVEAHVSLKYLLEFCKSKILNKTVTLYFPFNHTCIRQKYILQDDRQNEIGTIAFYVAQKTKSDEENK